MSNKLPKDMFFIPIFLRKEAIDIIQKNNLYYDANTQKGNIACWLGDIATLNPDDIREIKKFIISPDRLSKEFLKTQLLGEIPER